MTGEERILSFTCTPRSWKTNQVILPGFLACSAPGRPGQGQWPCFKPDSELPTCTNVDPCRRSGRLRVLNATPLGSRWSAAPPREESGRGARHERPTYMRRLQPGGDDALLHPAASTVMIFYDKSTARMRRANDCEELPHERHSAHSARCQNARFCADQQETIAIPRGTHIGGTVRGSYRGVGHAASRVRSTNTLPGESSPGSADVAASSLYDRGLVRIFTGRERQTLRSAPRGVAQGRNGTQVR